MKTIETIGTVTADGKMFLDVPKDLAPGKHLIRVDVDEAVRSDFCEKNGLNPDFFPDGQPRKYYRGNPVLTQEEMKRLKCPFPPEPEWEEEWNAWERERKNGGTR